MVSAAEFRQVCGQFATGITIVTTVAGDGSPQGMTANSFTSVSLEPPMVLVCVDLRAGRMLECFEQAGRFAVNILAEAQKELSNRFARQGLDRFEGVSFEQGTSGMPLLPGSLATMECIIRQSVDAGDHRILLGEVTGAAIQAGVPLLYYGSGYRLLSD